MLIYGAVYIIAAENIPRTLSKVYEKARKLFRPNLATKRWSKKSAI